MDSRRDELNHGALSGRRNTPGRVEVNQYIEGWWKRLFTPRVEGGERSAIALCFLFAPYDCARHGFGLLRRWPHLAANQSPLNLGYFLTFCWHRTSQAHVLFSIFEKRLFFLVLLVTFGLCMI